MVENTVHTGCPVRHLELVKVYHKWVPGITLQTPIEGTYRKTRVSPIVGQNDLPSNFLAKFRSQLGHSREAAGMSEKSWGRPREIFVLSGDLFHNGAMRETYVHVSIDCLNSLSVFAKIL